MDRQSFLDHLTAYRPFDTAEVEMRDRMVEFVTRNDRCFDREFPEGHITASCWIVNALPEGARQRGQALLTWHKRLNRWLQMGGHLEPGDLSLLEASLREAREECGLHVELGPLVDIYSYPGVAVIVIVYAATVLSGALMCDDESLEARFFHLQVVQHAWLVEEAADRQRREITDKAKRGEIVDRSGEILAYSVDADSIVAVPAEVNATARCVDFWPLKSGRRLTCVQFDIWQYNAVSILTTSAHAISRHCILLQFIGLPRCSV